MFNKLLIISLSALAFPLFTLASATSGTILTPYAWGENTGWVNFAPTGGNIQITDTAITGYAWDRNYGWINLNPSQSGVKNDGEGRLSGYGWSIGGGYINFYGIKINSAGKFTGTANGTIYGHLSFDCDQCNVTTDWRPVSVRATASASNGPISGSFVSSLANYFFPKTASSSSKAQTASVSGESDINNTLLEVSGTPNQPNSGSSRQSSGQTGQSGQDSSFAPGQTGSTSTEMTTGGTDQSYSSQNQAQNENQKPVLSSLMGKRAAIFVLASLVVLVLLRFLIF